MLPNTNSLKLSVQKKIVFVSVILLVAKFIAFYLTNSVGILTDALESIVNVTAGAISLYSIYLAIKPKDADHPYGHGKIELISASVEGILIMVAGGFIIYEGIYRFFKPSPINELDFGIIIIIISGTINYLLGWYSIHIGKKHHSIALVAGGKHLHSDAYSTIGLVIGLILLLFTGYLWIDSVIALIFGLIIVITGINILRKTISNLMDEADFSVITKIKEQLISMQSTLWIDIHNVKVVKYGETLHIDCDLILPWYLNIKEAHTETDILKHLIKNSFEEQVDLTIHVDACFEELCPHCLFSSCIYRKHPFSSPRDISISNLISTRPNLH